jgi:hypothetical protein
MIFLASFLIKIIFPKKFLSTVVRYRAMPVRLGYSYSVIVIVFEFLIAIALIIGWQTRWPSLAAIGLLFTFILATSGIIVRKDKFICGQAGLLYVEPVSWLLLVRDTILIILLIFISLAIERIPNIFIALTKGAIGLRIVTCLSLIFVVYVTFKIVKQDMPYKYYQLLIKRSQIQFKEWKKRNSHVIDGGIK